MFDLINKTRSGSVRTLVASTAIQLTAVGFLLAIPLVWTDILPKAHADVSIELPAPPPPTPPPAPPRKTVQVKRTVKIFNLCSVALCAPKEIPNKISFVEDNNLSTDNIPEGIPSDFQGIPDIGLNVGHTPSFAPPPPPQPPKADSPKPKQEGPIRQSSGVQSAKLINGPKPHYPPIAKQAHIQGAVVLQATIGKDGTVQNLKVMSSANPLLTPAAIEAVRQWIYIPTILNNEPVEVLTEITVNFSLQ